MAILILATLTPFVIQMPEQGVGHLLLAALHPRMTPKDMVDGVRNVVLFAGWGLLWVLSARPGRAGTTREIRGAVVSGASLSVTLELIQLFVPTRTTSILDVLTNTTGALLGAAAAVGLVVAARVQRRRRSFLGVPMSHVAIAYGIAIAFEATFPLMRSGRPGTFGGPLTRFAWSLRHLAPGSLLHLPLFEALLFLPAGFLAAAALVEAGASYRDAARWTAVGGTALAVAGEAAHLFLAEPVVLGAVIVHAGAVAAGGWLAGWRLPAMTRSWHGRMRPLLFLAAYVIILALWTWRPFDLQVRPGALAHSISWRRLVPMASLDARSDLYTVSDVAVAFFLFVPVGIVLAAWPLKREGSLSGLLPAFVLAVALEAGQVFVAYRYVDITDAIETFAGAAVAWAVLREAGYPIRGTLLEGEMTGVAGAGRGGGG